MDKDEARIRRSLALIESVKHDDARAHSEQDNLYVYTLVAIAMGAENPSRLAQQALRVQEIQFERWCA